jgi:serine/threonine protein kinase
MGCCSSVNNSGLVDMMEDQQYRLLKKIGYGAYSEVWLSEDRNANKNVAIKVISKTKTKAKQYYIQVWNWNNEVNILSSVDHPNIVKYRDHFENEINFYVVTDMCSGGDLHTRITNKSLKEKDNKLVCISMLNALKYLHEHGICHRDIKPENFAFTMDDVLVLLDFGCSIQIRDHEIIEYIYGTFGTEGYIAPELLSSATNINGLGSKSADMWSMGATLFFVLSGGHSFVDVHKYTNNELSELACDLLHHILKKEPEKRLSAEQALLHPLLSLNN